MKATRLAIPEVVLIEPKVFGDARGFFFESFNQKAFNEATGTNHQFVQDNHSRSAKGVLRGLHYQIQQPQGKLVRVVRGAVFDVAVDIRKSSPTFGRWVGAELSEDNQHQLWVPPGFAHGFLLQWLNPKAWIAAAAGTALFAQAAVPHALWTFIGIYFVVCYASLALWAWLSRTWLGNLSALVIGDYCRWSCWAVLRS